MREDFIEIPVISRKLPFVIYMAGTSYCDKTYRIYRPNSAAFCMEYILSGKGTLKTQGKTFYPQKGDTYMCLLGDTHEYYSDPDDPWIKIWFNATGPLTDQLVDIYKLRNHTVFHCNSEKFIRNIHSVLSNKTLSPQQISEQTSIIFHQFIQFLSNNIEEGQAHSIEAITLKNYIDNHICTDISIDELSTLVNKSESQTIRIFKQHYHKTPYNYHLNNKLRRAELLLETTALSIKEITYHLGFCDEHYFTGLFKRKKGLTPSEYRKNLTINNKI